MPLMMANSISCLFFSSSSPSACYEKRGKVTRYTTLTNEEKKEHFTWKFITTSAVGQHSMNHREQRPSLATHPSHFNEQFILMRSEHRQLKSATVRGNWNATLPDFNKSFHQVTSRRTKIGQTSRQNEIGKETDVKVC